MNENFNGESPRGLTSPQTQEYLKAFWPEFSQGSDHLLDRWDKRTMLSGAIWGILGPQRIHAPQETIEELSLFEFKDWLPKTRSEASLANNTSSLRHNPAVLKRYADDALKDRHNLLRVMKGNRGGFSDLDLKALRQDQVALFTMADHLMHSEFFYRGSWPNRNRKEGKEDYSQRQRYWRGMMLAAAEFADDNTLSQLFDHVNAAVNSRAEYWKGERDLLARSAGSIALKNDVNPDAFKAEPKKTQKEERDLATTIDSNLLVKKELERAALEMASKSRHIETLVDQGWGREAAELRVLGARGIYYEGELVGSEAKDEPRQRPSATGSKPKRRSPTKYGHRDKGPPPHIAEEIRRSQRSD